MRKPSVFRKSAEIIQKHYSDKLILVKMGPYEEHDKKKWLELVGAFMEGGGDGISAVNTYKVLRSEVPSQHWGYESAGKSGHDLRPYRMRAVKDTRKTFPESVIFATGGIFDATDTYETFCEGSNAVQGYTPYAFYGLGLVPKLMKGVLRILQRNGYVRLEKLLEAKRRCDDLVY